MYSWTIRQDALNRSLIFIENSSIYHMARTLSFRIASPRICTVFRRFSSVGLFFLKYFSVSFEKKSCQLNTKKRETFLCDSVCFMTLWVSVGVSSSSVKNYITFRAFNAEAPFCWKSTPSNNRIIFYKSLKYYAKINEYLNKTSI